MNRYSASLLLLVLTVLACKKVDEQINNNQSSQPISQDDSTYLSSVETPQQRNVLIELKTGVGNANSPSADNKLSDIQNQYPNRISIAALHGNKSEFNKPLAGLSNYDFRQFDAEQIISFLGDAPFPSVALAREGFNNNNYFDTRLSSWQSRVDTMLTKSSSVNIHLQNTYFADKDSCELIAQIAYTQEIFESLFLSVYIVENSIKDYQQNGAVKESNYIHNNVFRDCLTNVLGSNLDFGGRKAGTVLQKRIKFGPTVTGDNAWNLDNCRIIAFVHRHGTDATILHSQEIDLK